MPPCSVAGPECRWAIGAARGQRTLCARVKCGRQRHACQRAFARGPFERQGGVFSGQNARRAAALPPRHQRVAPLFFRAEGDLEHGCACACAHRQERAARSECRCAVCLQTPAAQAGSEDIHGEEGVARLLLLAENKAQRPGFRAGKILQRLVQARAHCRVTRSQLIK